MESPVKKKRGRKPKPKTEIDEIKIPKKRGRKHKIKIITEEEKNKFVLPSKRGRKPKDKNNVLNKNLNLDNISNLILHLPIPLEKIEEIDNNNKTFDYNPIINNPYPYDPLSINNEININENVDDCIYTLLDNNENIINENNSIQNNNINTNNNNNNNNNIKEEYNNYIKIYSKIQKNNIRCNWCFHNCDDNNIFKLPYNIVNNDFNLYGNFCCPECAVAFNFNELNDEYVWERYALLNYLYNDSNIKLGISPIRLILDI